MTFTSLRAWALALLLFSATSHAQAPLVLNTTVRSFTPVSASPWVADIWGYTDSLGRDFALVCRGNSGLSVYDITNPTAPVFASSIPATASDLKDVKVYQDHAYCVQQGGPVLIVDLSNPYAISVVGSFSSNGHNGFVTDDGTYYYARSGGSPNGVEIWDITAPASPVFRSLYDPPSFNAHDCYAEGDRLYAQNITGGSAGSTHIVDVSDRTNPVFLSSFPHGPSEHSSWMYHPTGGAAKVLCVCNETQGGHIQFWDVSDDLNPIHLSSAFSDPAISIHNPVVAGRYCFVSWYADYLRIFDLADPTHPVLVGIYDPDALNIGASTFDGAWGAVPVRPLPGGGYRVVMTESFRLPRGFWVIDFQPPTPLSLDLVTSGVGDFGLHVAGADPGSEMWNLLSVTPSSGLGTGPLAGLAGDALFGLTLPLGAGPFHVSADGMGHYDFVLPAASAPPGIVAEFRSVGLISGTWALSEIGRIVF